jgi:hypothetical protein
MSPRLVNHHNSLVSRRGRIKPGLRLPLPAPSTSPRTSEPRATVFECMGAAAAAVQRSRETAALEYIVRARDGG